MGKLIAALFACLLAFSASVSASSYTTDFFPDETPLSEGGAWRHLGLDWTIVQLVGGIAFGTQTGTEETDDSYAYLSGFSNDHYAEGTVSIDPSGNFTCSKEVEILLRWSDAAHSAKGYEVTFTRNGYAGISVWEGPFNAYHTINQPGDAVGCGVNGCDGHVFGAGIVGNVITVYIDGQAVRSYTDNSHPTGQPGVGFFRRQCGDNFDIGFHDYHAQSLPDPTRGAALAFGAIALGALRRWRDKRPHAA